MNKYIALSVISLILASCGGSAPDSKTELENLRKQESEIKSQIAILEKEMGSDSSNSANGFKHVVASQINSANFVHYIELQGKVDADENVTVSPKTSGVVTRILVQTGDQVRVGQILAELDNAVMQNGIEELKSALAFANNLYVKQKNLWDQKIGTEIQYLSAKNNKESLEKKLATTMEQSEMSVMKSPITGVIDAVDIKIGQSVMSGMPAVRVVNMNKLKVKAEASESYASKIKKGNSVLIDFPDLKEQVKSEIQYASRVINNLSRTFGVEANLSGDGSYHPNMLAVIKIADYTNDSSLVVPLNVIQNTEEGSYLFIAKKEGAKSFARKVVVKTGLTYKGRTEILSGISQGDWVITTGFQDLNDGEQINL